MKTRFPNWKSLRQPIGNSGYMVHLEKSSVKRMLFGRLFTTFCMCKYEFTQQTSKMLISQVFGSFIPQKINVISSTSYCMNVISAQRKRCCEVIAPSALRRHRESEDNEDTGAAGNEERRQIIGENYVVYPIEKYKKSSRLPKNKEAASKGSGQRYAQIKTLFTLAFLMASSSQVANSQDFIRLFIEMYRSLPCLWKVKSPDYSNKYKKKVAYEKLVNLYQENHPSETVDEAVIKKKIQALRTVFKKELNKVEKSTRSGAGTDEVYVPKLWYYNLLEFTRDQEIPRVMHCSMSLPQEEETVTRPDSPLVDHVTEEVSPTPCVIPETPATSNPTDEEAEEASVSVGAYTVQRRNPVSRKRKATAPPFPEFVDIAKNILVLQEKQAIGGFAHMVDERLRSLDVTQRLQAERIIFEALNKAAVGQLKDSYILVDSQAMSITPWPQTQEQVTSTPRRVNQPLHSMNFGTPHWQSGPFINPGRQQLNDSDFSYTQL
ncbi:uncharacterized protein [Dendrobates tinctorius]|uniref:uncharacterized protein n=1 Tax=Dendrobates tinctorius TaxID=92724 RepID=UPI003CCA0CEE